MLLSLSFQYINVTKSFVLVFFFYLFESSEKSAPKYTAISWISVAVADLRETARVHSPAASALLTSILKELRCNMKVNFWDRQNSLALGLPSPLSPNNSELFFPQDWKLYSGTLEMVSLYHERSLHLPMNTYPQQVPAVPGKELTLPCSHAVACHYSFMEDDLLIR